MQRRHGVDVQTLEQQVVQMPCRVIQPSFRFLRIAGQRREIHLRVRVIRRQFDALHRHHADARIFDIAHQLGQIALDLIRDLYIAIGGSTFLGHDVSVNLYAAGCRLRTSVRPGK